MKAKQSDDLDTEIVESLESPDCNSKASLTTKLERRRRIEELDEARQLREELGEF